MAELICNAKGPDHKILNINATLTSNESTHSISSASIQWRVVTPTGAVYESGVHESNANEIAQQAVAIKTKSVSASLLLDTARPAVEIGGQQTRCTTLMNVSSIKPTIKPAATCNAIGTPSQGWYANGRLVKHSTSCNMEVLACGTSNEHEGWFVQRKIDRVRVAAEQCAWRREKPVCKNKDGTSAWFLGDRLIARDDECHQKSIECVPSPKYEGWFTYRRSEPQLLVASGCGGSISKQRTAKNRQPEGDSVK